MTMSAVLYYVKASFTRRVSQVLDHLMLRQDVGSQQNVGERLPDL